MQYYINLHTHTQNTLSRAHYKREGPITSHNSSIIISQSDKRIKNSDQSGHDLSEPIRRAC